MGFFSGLIKGAIGLLGGGQGILGGVSSAMDYKAQKEAEEIRQKGQLEQVKEGGRQQRQTSLYETQLAGAVDEYGRARKRGAFKNFAFAAKNDPYAQAVMSGYEQQWKPEDTKMVLPQPDKPVTPPSLAAPRR